MTRAITSISIAAVTMFLAGGTAANPNRWCSQFNDSIFCDDFDRDCPVDQQPPQPQVCADNADGAVAQVRGIWQYNSYIAGTSTTCGSNMVPETANEILPTQPFGGRHANGGDEGGTLGQNTAYLDNYIGRAMPGYTQANGSDAEPLVLTFTMGAMALNAMQYNNGYLELSAGDPARANPVTDPAKAATDWILVGTKNPNGCVECALTCPEGETASPNPWPSICQQEFPNPACPAKSTVVRNALAIGALAYLDNNPCHCCSSTTPGKTGYASRCPAEYRNPDFKDGWQEPTNWHLSYFDGVEWRVLRAGMGGPGSYGDFRWGNYWIYLEVNGTILGNTDSAWEEVRITVKTHTVDIYHKTKNVESDGNGGWIETWVESLATDLPRRYSGGFNRLRAGTDEGCELLRSDAPNYAGTYACDADSDHYYRRRCKMNLEYGCDGPNKALRSSYVAFDNVRLYGGVGVLGACCLGNGTCSVLSPNDCAAAQGMFRGSGTTCSGSICQGACCLSHTACTLTSNVGCSGRFRGIGTDCSVLCCPSPFADHDGDHDVDATDFSALQLCLTGGVEAIKPGCDCFDQDKNNEIDLADVTAFIDCATGPSVVPGSILPECAP